MPIGPHSGDDNYLLLSTLKPTHGPHFELRRCSAVGVFEVRGEVVGVQDDLPPAPWVYRRDRQTVLADRALHLVLEAAILVTFLRLLGAIKPVALPSRQPDLVRSLTVLNLQLLFGCPTREGCLHNKSGL